MRRLLRIAAAFAALALVTLACGSAAAPSETGGAAPTQAEPIPHSPTEEVLATPPGDEEPGEGSEGEPAPAIFEARFVELEWPAAIRVGDSDFIRLALVPGEDGLLTPTAITEEHVTQGEPIQIPDLYATHNVLAVAELSAVGLEVDRPGEISQPLLPGEPVEWQWTVAPKSAGSQVATLGIHLRFVPKEGGQETQRAVWARPLTIEGRTVFGLSGRAADLLGVAGSVSGGLLGFPFADKVYGWVFRRLFKRKT
jgi:hypothetical protein